MGKPVRCGRCGRENDPSFAFCLDCGQPLRTASAVPGEPVCAACGARLQPSFRFCGRCGRPVAATPPSPAAARPPATPPPPADLLAVAATTSSAFEDGAPPRPSPGGLRLTAVRHDGRPAATFPLDRPELVCGRSAGEVRLPDDPTVSPRHARFTVSGGAVRVEDLGSVNGTFLRLRAPRALSVGDELRLGRQLLRLEPQPRPAQEGAVRAWGGRDEGRRLRLVQLLDGGGVGETFPLRAGANDVGRDAGDVTFPGDRWVSARHARIEVGADGAAVSDVGSSNGTFLKIVGAVDLAPGDELVVGMQLLRLDA